MNIGGIGGYICEELRKNNYLSHFIVFHDGTMRQNHDLNLDYSEYRIRYKLVFRFIFFIFCIFHYKIFHFYFAKTLLPFGIDLPILRLFGKKIIMQYCGSDVRLIDIEKKRNPYHNLLNSELDNIKYDAMKKRRMWWQSIWVNRVIAVRDSVAPVKKYYKSSNIISDIWVHNTFDIKKYKLNNNFNFNYKNPLIVHAPSNPGIKGTEYVENVLGEMKLEGYKFRYLRLEGIENHEAQRIYREEADIILDQFLIGCFGNLVLEAMYAEKPVVTYLLEDIQKEYCNGIPVINANIDTLKSTVSNLLDTPESWVELGKKGRDYVEKKCDRKKIVSDLITIYMSL